MTVKLISGGGEAPAAGAVVRQNCFAGLGRGLCWVDSGNAIVSQPSRDIPCATTADPPELIYGEALVHLGWALLALRSGPLTEICIRLLDVPADEGCAMLGVLDTVIRHPGMSGGFVLVYDQRDLALPQSAFLQRILEWSIEPIRNTVWHSLCYGWKLVITEGPLGSYLFVARLVLGSVLREHPVATSVCFVTDPDEPCEDVLFHQEAAGELEQSVGLCEGPGLLDVEWAHISRHHEEDPAQLPELRVTGQDMVVLSKHVEDVPRIFAYIDAFVRAPAAQERGFVVTYDLRLLHWPPIAVFSALGDAGKERQEEWKPLNRHTRIVVPNNWTYSIFKTFLTAFFFTCPPVCRTYLTTSLDEDLAGACAFEPGHTELTALDVAATAQAAGPGSGTAQSSVAGVDRAQARGQLLARFPSGQLLDPIDGRKLLRACV